MSRTMFLIPHTKNVPDTVPVSGTLFLITNSVHEGNGGHEAAVIEGLASKKGPVQIDAFPYSHFGADFKEHDV